MYALPGCSSADNVFIEDERYSKKANGRQQVDILNGPVFSIASSAGVLFFNAVPDGVHFGQGHIGQ